MATTAENSTRTRRTASRAADALVGERAHMLIWRSGKTQTAIASELGIESTAFGKKLRGKNGWAIQELLDLAATLGTTVAYLVGESDEPTGAPPRPVIDVFRDGTVAITERPVVDLFTREAVA